MKETNYSPLSKQHKTPSPMPMPNSSEPVTQSKPDELCEQLLIANEQLQAQLAASEAARMFAESQVLQLVAIVEEDAEALQEFGSNWFVPSKISSITRDPAGILIDGAPMGSPEIDPNDRVAQMMRTLATQINAKKIARRERLQSVKKVSSELSLS